MNVGQGCAGSIRRVNSLRGRRVAASFIHAMAHVQRLKIEVQNLKDALDTSQKIANRYSLLGVFDHRQ